MAITIFEQLACPALSTVSWGVGILGQSKLMIHLKAGCKGRRKNKGKDLFLVHHSELKYIIRIEQIYGSITLG